VADAFTDCRRNPGRGSHVSFDGHGHIIHGVFTYDYFSILKAVTKPDGTLERVHTHEDHRIVNRMDEE
jgi:hypothetical protein